MSEPYFKEHLVQDNNLLIEYVYYAKFRQTHGNECVVTK